MPVLPFLIATVCVLTIAYRYYSGFLATKVLMLAPERKTPAYTKYDGQNFYPTNRWVLFGHHFAAITGAGPLIGPVLAAQFGFLPGFLWLLIGVVIGGAVQDFIMLTASVRYEGKSIAEIAKKELGPVSGAITSIAILFIIIIALSGLGVAVVNALAESSWGVFTISMSIPLAFAMGIYIYKFNAGSDRAIKVASIVGVLILFAAVVFGKPVSETIIGEYFKLSKNQITFAVAAYGFIASVLPVWLLLCPRDYLSSYMKLGTIFFLVAAVFIVQPDLKMPAFSQWVNGGGPIIPGKLFPFVFITIACGAISGFHALIATGTTPKMIKSEMDCRTIGYGAMLLEGMIGIVALIAAASLHPEDYFAINLTKEKFMALGMHTINLPELELQVGETVSGRPGGAVSLAVGMAQIFSSLPLMKKLMSYWYHFAIMFEALFILTTIDTGTRVARFLVQENLGKISPSLSQNHSIFSSFLSTGLVVGGWSYFIFTGSISTIWPMFGIANQLLATIALSIGSVYLCRLGKQKYLAVTLVPLAFIATTTLTAAYMSIRDQFWKMTEVPATSINGYLNSGITALMMGCAVLILGDSLVKIIGMKPKADSA